MADESANSTTIPVKRKTTSETETLTPSCKPVKRKREDDESDSEDDDSGDRVESGDGNECKDVAKPNFQIFPGFLQNDVRLVVEDQHLYLNKDLLSSASPVFEAWLKEEWQNNESTDGTKRELQFPGKTYDEMATFLKCLLSIFPDKVTDESLDTVLPLADEYRTDKLITECVEVIRQRAESVYKTDIYIPPSRIATYLLWIEKFNLHTVKEALVEISSYLDPILLEDELDYGKVSHKLKLDISSARANLFVRLLVSNVTEAKEKMYQFNIPFSSYYVAEWRQHVAKLVNYELESSISEQSKWPKTTAYKDLNSKCYYGKPCVSQEILNSFACLEICDKLNFPKSFAKVVNRIKSLEIGKSVCKLIWLKYYSTNINNANDAMERLSLGICQCT